MRAIWIRRPGVDLVESYHEYTEREAREEAFRDDLERRYRDDPAFWAWWEEKRKENDEYKGKED